MHLTHRNRIRRIAQIFAILGCCGPPLPSGEGLGTSVLSKISMKVSEYIHAAKLSEMGAKRALSAGEDTCKQVDREAVGEIHPTDALLLQQILQSFTLKKSTRQCGGYMIFLISRTQGIICCICSHTRFKNMLS